MGFSFKHAFHSIGHAITHPLSTVKHAASAVVHPVSTISHIAKAVGSVPAAVGIHMPPVIGKVTHSIGHVIAAPVLAVEKHVIDPVIAKPATAIYNAVGKPVVNAAESVVDGTVSGVANMAGGLVGLGGGGGGGARPASRRWPRRTPNPL
jgi:hypothetical protein